MGTSSAAYEPISPTNLDNFTNPLRLPGDDGVMHRARCAAYCVG
jgi:hypothetical protein